LRALILVDVAGVGRANLLDDLMGKVVALGDSRGNVGTLDKLRNKSTAEGITSTVAVNDLGLRDGNNGVLLNGSVSLSNNGVVNTLGEDNETLTLGVDLGQLGDVGSDSLDVLGIGQVVGKGIGLSLTLVTKDNIHVRKDFVEDLGEELRNERGGEVHGEDLVLGGGVLGNLEDTLGGDSKEETLDVVDLSALNQVPGLLRADVINGQFLGSRQLGDEGTVMARNQGGAGTGGEIARNGDILGGEAISSGSRHELGGELIISSSSNIHDGLGRQAALGTAGGVLTGTTGNVDNIRELGDLLVPTRSTQELIAVRKRGRVIITTDVCPRLKHVSDVTTRTELAV